MAYFAVLNSRATPFCMCAKYAGMHDVTLVPGEEQEVELMNSERKSDVMHPSVLCAQTKWRSLRISSDEVGQRKRSGS